MRLASLVVPTLLLSLTVGSVAADPPPNPFAGSWGGSYTSTGANSGTIEFTVADSGVLLGSVQDVVGGFGTLRGVLLPSGAIHFTFQFEPGSSGTIHGTAVIDSAGDLVLDTVRPDTGVQYEGTLSPL